jgi:hypothetical protein
MNRKFAGIAITTALILIPTLALTQEGQEQPQMTPEQVAEMEAYMKAGTPGPPHAELAAGVGSYDLAITSWHEPGGPPMEETGTAVRTMELEGRVLVEKLSSSVMGMPFTGHGMTGFDNVTGKYWSTWTDSISTGIMVSEGSCDAEGVCTYIGSWNDPITKGPHTVRLITRWTSPTTQFFEMYGPGKDGKEMKMMEMTYTKK